MGDWKHVLRFQVLKYHVFKMSVCQITFGFCSFHWITFQPLEKKKNTNPWWVYQLIHLHAPLCLWHSDKMRIPRMEILWGVFHYVLIIIHMGKKMNSCFVTFANPPEHLGEGRKGFKIFVFHLVYSDIVIILKLKPKLKWTLVIWCSTSFPCWSSIFWMSSSATQWNPDYVY